MDTTPVQPNTADDTLESLLDQLSLSSLAEMAPSSSLNVEIDSFESDPLAESDQQVPNKQTLNATFSFKSLAAYTPSQASASFNTSSVSDNAYRSSTNALAFDDYFELGSNDGSEDGDDDCVLEDCFEEETKESEFEPTKPKKNQETDDILTKQLTVLNLVNNTVSLSAAADVNSVLPELLILNDKTTNQGLESFTGIPSMDSRNPSSMLLDHFLLDMGFSGAAHNIRWNIHAPSEFDELIANMNVNNILQKTLSDETLLDLDATVTVNERDIPKFWSFSDESNAEKEHIGRISPLNDDDFEF
ncbi:UNVERIFIED_CONTAM: hypothetical protein HDU68_001811 [Siphonaria sp. JEL0065]|nr:hypothetical protein HDU68_001811 [Siphonaria sp. JEL0065]